MFGKKLRLSSLVVSFINSYSSITIGVIVVIGWRLVLGCFGCNFFAISISFWSWAMISSRYLIFSSRCCILSFFFYDECSVVEWFGLIFFRLIISYDFLRIFSGRFFTDKNWDELPVIDDILVILLPNCLGCSCCPTNKKVWWYLFQMISISSHLCPLVDCWLK